MKNPDPLNLLRSAHPAMTEPAAPDLLFDSIVSTPVERRPTPRRNLKRALKLFTQGLLGLVAISILGVGVTWAATGENPVVQIFTNELSTGESSFGMDQFSILEPISEEEFESLSPMTLSMANMVRMPNTKDEAKAAGGMFGSYVSPGLISSIGFGKTSAGTPVTVFVVDDSICAKWKRSAGNCGSLDQVASQGSIGYGQEHDESGRWHAHGLVADGIETITVEGSGLPPTQVVDNVYELHDLEPRNWRLIGRNAEGEEVLRTGLPIGSVTGQD